MKFHKIEGGKMKWIWLLSKDGSYYYAKHNPSVRADLNGNVYGGGCFSGGGGEFTPPPAPQFKTAPELFNEAISLGRAEFPLAYGAREAALGDIGRKGEFYQEYFPEGISPMSPEFWARYQPTDFEQAIAQSTFGPMMTQAQRQASHIASLAGLPGTATTRFTRAIAPTMYNMGTFLAGQGQRRGEIAAELGEQRAARDLLARLGIDPMAQILMPHVGVGAEQDRLQQQANYQAALAKAQADYAQSQGGGYGSLIGTGAGAGLGALLALPIGGLSVLGGAALGGSLGGTAGSLFGGGPAPISFGDALSFAQSPMGFTSPGTGGGKALPVNLPAKPVRLPTLAESADLFTGFGGF